MNWNELIAVALIVAVAIGTVTTLLVLSGWNVLCRINDLYDMQVIARGRDCNLEDSASAPTESHQRPVAVLPAVPTCEREAVGTSDKPAAAGSSLPRVIPPDGFDLHAPGARQKIAAQLTKAAQFVSSGDEDDAHDLALLAVHELSCILHERRADKLGVAR